ncbi:MAG: RagB/SusD family nutrient uptake outer membrane protein, partial [Sulfurimonas sp.]|nr:RagB/SusD family nutrient uptake outer membrane protein [Sulfurimonas sp.]
RIELAFEHDRWFDIGRQGRKGDVMRANGKNFTDGKHDLLPIPLPQIQLSGFVLEQNPGY